MKNLYLIKTASPKTHVVAETIQEAASKFQEKAEKGDWVFKEIKEIKLIETDIIF